MGNLAATCVMTLRSHSSACTRGIRHSSRKSISHATRHFSGSTTSGYPFSRSETSRWKRQSGTQRSGKPWQPLGSDLLLVRPTDRVDQVDEGVGIERFGQHTDIAVRIVLKLFSCGSVGSEGDCRNPKLGQYRA